MYDIDSKCFVMPAMAALPTTGNCSDFTIPLGDQSQNRPDQSFELKVENFSATKSGSSVDLSVTGITNQFAGGSGAGNDFIQGAGAWFVIQKCDATTGQITTITDSSASTTIAGANATSAFTLTDSNIGQSRYYYIAYAVMSFVESFGNVSPSADVSQASYDATIARFNTGTATTKITWSSVLDATVSFLPEQPHVVYNSSDVSNFSTDVNGFVVPASTPALASTTLGEAVSYTFTTTAEASTIAATPSFSFTYSLVDSAGSPASVDHLTFTTNGNALTVSGTIPTNNTTVTQVLIP